VPKDRYHHGQLRDALLDAAELLVAEHGIDGWSLREASAGVGVAASAAYHHFASREALVSALAERVLTGLGERMRRSTTHARADDPVQPLIAYARTYVRWTIENHALAAFAFAAARRIDPATVISPHPRDVLAAVLDRLVETGALNSRARPGAEFTVWPAVHGLAVLSGDGLIRHRSRRAADLEAERLVRALLTGLNDQATPIANWPAPQTAHTERVAAQP
jgi:AcrR family transcriptional regulator